MTEYILKIAKKVRNVILLLLVVLLLFAPVRAQAYVNTHTVTTVAQKGDFIAKEGLRWYKTRVEKAKAEREKEIKAHKINYDDAKKYFISKHDRLKRDGKLKELWDAYKERKDDMTRREQMDLIKILDIILEKNSRNLLPFWGEYYNVNHEIQDKLLSLYDKNCIEEVKEILIDPSKVEEYEIDYTWHEKAQIKAGFWIRYTEPVEVDKEFHKLLGGSSFDRVRHYMKKELRDVEKFNQSVNPMPPVMPIAPGI